MHIVLFRIGLFSQEQVRSYPYKKFKLNPQKPSNHETQPSFICLSDYQFYTILNLSKSEIKFMYKVFSLVRAGIPEDIVKQAIKSEGGWR